MQEPEYGENNPSDKFISEYPLGDVLDKFNCSINDTYYEENENDSEKSYVEIASDSIGNIKKLLSIIGKHVYIKEDGEIVLSKENKANFLNISNENLIIE